MPQNAPQRPSPSTRPTPRWYDDAKFGIFVHWGLYSVPAWAPVAGRSDVSADGATELDGPAVTPYAEWYWNAMHIRGSPTAMHHARTYGADVPYETFREPFEASLTAFDAAEWADVFRRAGARYVVPTTKHHDGYRLWPSRVANPRFGDYHPPRDLIGELADATRAVGMRFGTYYSGGIDWTFLPQTHTRTNSIYDLVPESAAYVRYADAHWRELIERYQPAMMWNDIGYPTGSDLDRLFADYYAAVSDGIINNRFSQRRSSDEDRNAPPSDIVTPEYATFDASRPDKWEACRGIGHSFGYNQLEDERDYLSADVIVALLVDVVSKNGNLLLNTGPTGEARLHPAQVDRLLSVGAWLERNGDAIYGTRPWIKAEAQTDNGGDVRFTQREATLYATFLAGRPGPHHLGGMSVAEGATATLLADGRPVVLRPDTAGVTLVLPDDLPRSAVHSIAVTPAPTVQL